MKTILSVSNLSKMYDRQTILSNISFDVYEGEWLTILGHSGSGKTTLIKLLAGIEPVSSGKIIKNNEDITNAKIQSRQIGLVFQNYCLFPNMTVLKNITYAMTNTKLSKQEKRNKAMKLLSTMQLEHEANSLPQHLSGGQQQRVAIARVLAAGYNVILLDEAFSALDSNVKLKLQDFVKQLQADFNLTVISITHDVEEAVRLSDRLIILNNSKIEQIGSVKQILKTPSTDFVKTFVTDELTKRYKLLRSKHNESNKQN